MSKRQKGRRHRRVNRTPRPVGPSRHGAARPEPRPEHRAEQRHEPRVEGRVEARVKARSKEVPALGRHEARTWNGLLARGAEGASVDELCLAVGYQARTIVKHVAGLADHGLAELRDERWYATAEALESAGRQPAAAGR
ncbi:hypothetical protein [Streptomyces hesseae]|uniref:MarR family transcriptional regulator n=1 Tax=Streptomyces hesseae TaxID=3075519 RepID=A0ABU2SM11_9ACTN|nr:hypothetical protein [Streptomyces sp. DSM 40473]MDT0450024.1 hypothetical protein [Streptomyces sp. DSM 40473]